MKRLALILLSSIALAGPAMATDFSFTGNFAHDDDVQLFNFTVGATSAVTLETWSYAGGVNAAGQTIAGGGFDPILALFDSTGAEINQDDDGGGNVATDPNTGQNYDTFLQSTLGPGVYTVSVMEYDNFAIGPNLSNGFGRAGQGDFTAGFGCGAAAFNDVSGVAGFCQRDNHWAFDVLNVSSAVLSSGAPEPSTWAMMAIGVGLGGAALRRRKPVLAV